MAIHHLTLLPERPASDIEAWHELWVERIVRYGLQDLAAPVPRGTVREAVVLATPSIPR